MEFVTQEELGERVRSFREKAGESQAELGAVLGVDQSAISKIQTGARSLSARELLLLTEHFRVSTSELFEREPAEFALRAGEADEGAVHQALEIFREALDDYFAVESLVGR